MLGSRRHFLRTLAAAPWLGSGASRLLDSRDPASLDELQARLAADPLRPQCHLLPAKNWMNDPNGPIFWNGQYHMFFQYNPNAAVWGDMHWAHAVSPDMIHWKHMPVALAPTAGWDDADGCFTGSAVDNCGIATFLYTGVKSVAPPLATLRDGVHNFREVQCVATSTDPQLRTWSKWKSPVLQPPADPDLTGFRDPFLWQGRDTWYLGVASGLRKQGGRVLLYRSKDLHQWEYVRPLATGSWTQRENINPVDSGEMWECPDFFPLGSKHVLLYSTAGKVVWEVGELDPKELVFHAQRTGVLDHGAYYAQKTQLDAAGNRILWGWIPERRPEAEFSSAGWAGCMALPRVLTLSSENDLEMRIAPVAESLRAKRFDPILEQTSPDIRAKLLGAILLEDLLGELQWKSASTSFSMALEDKSGLWWSLQVARADSSITLRVNEDQIGLQPCESYPLSFRLTLDASVAEFFCNDRHAVTSRIYRQPNGPLRLKVTGSDGAAVSALQGWQLRPISPDRLTT